jgi:hypothetical protein
MEKLTKTLIHDNKRIVIVKEVHNFKLYNARKTYADLIIQKHVRGGSNFEDFNMVQEIVEKINKTYFEDYSINTTDREEKSDKIIESIKTKYPNVIILDRMEYVCDTENERCFAINSSLEKFFYDYGHHTMEGAVFFGHRIDKLNWLAPMLSD